MTDNRKTKDWVRARAYCNLDSLFSELHERVIQDVCSINDLPPKFRRNFLFEVKPTQLRNSQFCVTRYIKATFPDDGEEADPETVEFEKSLTAINITLSESGGEIRAVPTWDQKENTCFLRINGERYSVSEISQIALGAFFFGGDE